MKKTRWLFFIDNTKLTYILVIGIVLFGVFSTLNIPKESAPEVDFPIAVVSTALPGASAEDIEELVTNKIESRLRGLSDIDSVTSESSQGFSQITVSFTVDADSREKLDDIRTAMDIVKSELPEDASDPVVQQISFSDVPIITFSISGPYPIYELKGYAEDIKESLESIQDVSRVNVIGAPKEEIEVILNQEKLNQFGLSAAGVSQNIGISNVDLPIGAIETAGDVYTVRFAGRIKDADEILNIPVNSRGGTTVFLRDIAEVKTSFPEGSAITRFGEEGISESAVLIDVYKQSGEGDILSIDDKADQIIGEMVQNGIPNDIKVETIRSDADLIRTDLSNLIWSGVQTIAIVIAVLIIFLGWREALIMSIQVPLTFLTTLTVITYLGYTINFLTLFSLILSLGILIDTGIVVVESIFERMSKGASAREAAVDTLLTFEQPLIAGTLTTIFVFLPMLLMTGIIGKYVRSIPVTVTVVLLAAIVVSFGFITTFAVRFLKVENGQSEGGIRKVKEWIESIYNWYGKTLNKILSNQKERRKFMTTVIVLFLISITLPIFGIVKVEMFPSEDLDFISVNLENPVGTPLSVTNSMVEEIEAVLLEDKRIENFVSRSGSGASVGMLGSSGLSSHKANITVNLKKEREESSQEISKYLEDRFKKLVEAEVTVGQEAGGPPQGAPVQMKVLGDSLEDLEEAARILANTISEIDGTKNIDTGIPESNGELVFQINRAQARSYGVTELQVAQEIRSAISGFSATTIQKNGDDIDVNVRTKLGDGERFGGVNIATVEAISAITVSTPNFGAVPISSFGEVRLVPNRSSISHEDGERVLTVTADVTEGANSQVIVGQIQSQIPSLGLPDSVTVSFGGEAEDIAESFTSLGQAMVIGILAIFGLLVWQFKSYRQPLFVLMTIPLALIGVFLGLAISNNPISFPGFIGIVALAGIVVNNAIILIDSINSDRKDGMNIKEAIESSAKSRLQPIILTTLTTVSGMVPLAFSSPVWAPIAISIMAGLVFSTVLTLFVIPILYISFGEKEPVV